MTDFSGLKKFRDGPQEEVEETIDEIVPFDDLLVILAFDQSLANTGFALVFGKKVILTGNLKSKESLSGHEASLDRAVILYDEVHSLLERHKPDLVVYETPPVGGGRMIRPESSLMAATVLRVASAKLSLPTKMVGAQTAKKRLVGNGNAKKPEVREAIKKLDPNVMLIKPMNEGIFDAIALAWVAAEER